jgi:predicted amidohydrolase
MDNDTRYINRGYGFAREVFWAPGYPRAVRVAVSQFQPRFMDRQSNWEKLVDLAERTRADVVVFPELISCGYMYKDAAEIAPFADERSALRPLEEIARDARRVMIGGFAERANDGLYNSAFVVRPDGTDVYRKIHLWNYETRIFRPGAAPCTFPFGGHRLGVEICYDLQFPELAAYYARAGVEALLVPNAWPHEEPALDGGLEPYNHIAVATAFSHGMFVAVANRTGAEREALFPGQSTVTDPFGRQRRLDSAEGALVEDLDFSLVDRARRPNERNDLRTDVRLPIGLPVVGAEATR